MRTLHEGSIPWLYCDSDSGSKRHALHTLRAVRKARMSKNLLPHFPQPGFTTGNLRSGDGRREAALAGTRPHDCQGALPATFLHVHPVNGARIFPNFRVQIVFLYAHFFRLRV